MRIGKIAVIGAGTMGGGIAAHCANAGVSALLLDVDHGSAAAAIERMTRAEPSPFMVPHDARHLTPLGLDGDLRTLEDCDWIVEAIVENSDAKRGLYRRIADFVRPGAIVSSNTSTIALAALMDGMPARLRRSFHITHFFNPPRHMRLLEIVAGRETDPGLTAILRDFADRCLGKTVVICRDRPGFIANRLGCYWMVVAIAEAMAQNIAVEEADAALGKPFGIPRTGVFGLCDLVGIDLMPQVNASLAAALEKDDPFQKANVPLPFVARMIEAGLTGRKGKGGFYRINRQAGKRKEAIDFETGSYRPAVNVALDQETPLLMQETRLGRYARSVMLKTLAYAGTLVGDAADDISAIDTAMRFGYNWNLGPFELVDQIGLAEFRRLLMREGLAAAPIFAAAKSDKLYRDGAALGLDGAYVKRAQPDGMLRLHDVKSKSKPILRNAAASLWDLGDGVACFELETKMNTLDEAVFALLDETVGRLPQSHAALVVYSDAAHFSAGVNLNWLLKPARAGNWSAVEELTALGQAAFKRLKYAPFPSVAAVAGFALGGGCELMLHCSGVQAHAEARIGLVEAAVGILPGWDGCGELLARHLARLEAASDPMIAIEAAFRTIAAAEISTSAAHARTLLLLRQSDGITMNRERLLTDAKARAMANRAAHVPPAKPMFRLPGCAGRERLEAIARSGNPSPHDLAVASALAAVLTGGDCGGEIVTEDEMMASERREVMRLAKTPETLARIEHMLKTGKPLRN